MPNKAVQLYRLLRSTGRERRLGTVIFFITSRCNAKCETCFYHEELNRPGDMTFEEIARVSRTMPAITDLWLSGGEPTLRHDASEIIQLFVENNGLDGHYFNIVRGETKAGEGIKQVPPEVLPALYARVSALTAAYGERM